MVFSKFDTEVEASISIFFCYSADGCYSKRYVIGRDHCIDPKARIINVKICDNGLVNNWFSIIMLSSNRFIYPLNKYILLESSTWDG